MGALKQQAILMQEQEDYEADICMGIDILNVALEDAIYELLTLTSREEVRKKINKHYISAVIRLFPELGDVSHDNPGVIESS